MKPRLASRHGAPLKKKFEFSGGTYTTVGRDSSVGIATRYGLVGPGIELRWGRDFPHPSRPALGTGYLPGVKRPGRGVDHPPSSSAEVKERVEL